jgi:hypothetical protein
MNRVMCVVVGVLALAANRPPADVDAAVLVRAFRAGSADQYRNQRVRGTGVNFHGAVAERLADGTTRTSLVITVGAAGEAGAFTIIKTWDAFVAAERARTTQVVALSGVDLAAPSGQEPQLYEFSGIFDGQVRTIMRVPQSSDSTIPDSGPCKGEEPRGSGGSFYCAPLLVNATASPAGAKDAHD